MSARDEIAGSGPPATDSGGHSQLAPHAHLEVDAATTIEPSPLHLIAAAQKAADAAAADVPLMVDCATADDFVERYAAFVDESTLTLPADPRLDVGQERSFSITSRATGDTLIAGTCGAIELIHVPKVSGHACVRVHVLDVREEHQALHDRLIIEGRDRRVPGVSESAEARERLWGLFGRSTNAEPLPAPAAPGPAGRADRAPVAGGPPRGKTPERHSTELGIPRGPAPAIRSHDPYAVLRPAHVWVGTDGDRSGEAEPTGAHEASTIVRPFPLVSGEEVMTVVRSAPPIEDVMTLVRPLAPVEDAATMVRSFAPVEDAATMVRSLALPAEAATMVRSLALPAEAETMVRSLAALVEDAKKAVRPSADAAAEAPSQAQPPSQPPLPSPPPPPPSLPPGVMALSPPARSKRAPAWRRPALVAAAALVVVGAGAWALRGGAGAPSERARVSAPPPAIAAAPSAATAPPLAAIAPAPLAAIVALPVAEAKAAAPADEPAAAAEEPAAPAEEPAPAEASAAAPGKPGRTLLRLTSSPPGALIVIGKDKLVGRSPRTLDLKRKQAIWVTARLAGHQPWSRIVRPDGAEMALRIQMSPVPKARPRR